MQTDALVSAPLIVAAVFVASALGKLADRHRAAEAFDALEVPRPFAQPWMRAAHPWLELLLALGLVVTSGPAAVITAIVTTGLATVYLVLVVRAVRRPDPTDCACFGVVGSEQVSWWTVLRNVWLLGLCALSVWSALEPGSPLARVLGLGADGWWLGAVAAAAVQTALIVRPSRPEPSAPAEGSPGQAQPDEYVRTEIPHVPVTLADGTVVSLRELAVSRPKLILAVSETCGSCQHTIAASPQWRERLPELDIHLLYRTEPDPAAPTPDEPQTLHDPKRYAFEALHLQGTPSGVLLGADGLLAGGPVAGHDAISAFVTDVEAELAVARLLPT